MPSSSSYHHHYHHHVVPLARISLTLSRHFSLSFIASGRSSGLHPVSSHSCWMYVRAGRPAFARPYVGVHRSISLILPKYCKTFNSPYYFQFPVVSWYKSYGIKWQINISMHKTISFSNWIFISFEILHISTLFFISLTTSILKFDRADLALRLRQTTSQTNFKPAVHFFAACIILCPILHVAERLGIYKLLSLLRLLLFPGNRQPRYSFGIIMYLLETLQLSSIFQIFNESNQQYFSTN